MEITRNEKLNGIEVRFEQKPEQKILDVLRDNGFRWSAKQKMWYARYTDDRMSAINNLLSGGKDQISVAKTPVVYDLWEATRTGNIEAHKSYNNKEIASDIRKHLRSRFSFVKWSVTSDLHSVNVYIKESPFERGSEALKAIGAYAARYTNSWNYDNSDSMTDYFDVNFYTNTNGVVRYNGDIFIDYMLSYDFIHREATEAEKEMEAAFNSKLETYKAEQEAKRESEIAAMIEQQKEAERLHAEWLVREKEMTSRVEAEAQVTDTETWVMNLREPSINKLSSVEEYEENNEYTDCPKARVTREVRFANEETYKMFADTLLSDYSFLAGFGGSETEADITMNEYAALPQEERAKIIWFPTNCVAIYSGDTLKMVVDPQGHNYARYVYFPSAA